MAPLSPHVHHDRPPPPPLHKNPIPLLDFFIFYFVYFLNIIIYLYLARLVVNLSTYIYIYIYESCIQSVLRSESPSRSLLLFFLRVSYCFWFCSCFCFVLFGEIFGRTLFNRRRWADRRRIWSLWQSWFRKRTTAERLRASWIPIWRSMLRCSLRSTSPKHFPVSDALPRSRLLLQPIKDSEKHKCVWLPR